MRKDLKIISNWIEPGSRVLDLGCGQGELLLYLKRKKGCIGTGIELDETKVARCIEQGLSVLQGDINEEVGDYADGIFDYVILSQTLQQVYHPSELIASLLRIGKKGIVSFPSFSHWKVRLQLLLTGHAPITKELPYQWYDTPNIRVITIRDFRQYARQMGFRIVKETFIGSGGKTGDSVKSVLFPEIFAKHGIFMIE